MLNEFSRKPVCIRGYVAPQQLKVNIERTGKTVKKSYGEKPTFFECLAFVTLWTHPPAFRTVGTNHLEANPMIFFVRGRKNKGFWALFLAFVLVLSLACTDGAEAKTSSKARSKKKVKSRRPAAARVLPVDRSTARYADIVIEADTGRILQETNSQKILHPASLTKMMTLYLAFQAIESGRVRLETMLPVSANAAAQSPTKLGVRAGQRLRVYDAVMGLVTESANDAAVVLAEGLAGSVPAFAALMNRQAKTLGMRSTHFRNPSGLPDPDQVTSARDMAILGYALIAHYPGFYPYFSRESFVYAGRSHRNHNRLMSRYEGMDGIKTGYIRASGFNLVASAMRGETRLVGVVFGGQRAVTRDNQMAALLDEGFAQIASERQAGLMPARTGRAFLPLPSKVAAAFPSGRDSLASQTYGGEAETTEERGEDESYGGAWSIQVGAFSEMSGAQQALTAISRFLKPLLDSAEPSLQKITMTDGSVMYRARFTGLSQDSARTACAHLVRQGQGCLVVSGP